MKKARGFLFFLILTGFSLTANAQNRNIFIEGTADRQDQQWFFLENFQLEAVSSGYDVARIQSQAGYTFQFEVNPNVIMYDDGSTGPASADEKQYVILITLIRNTDNMEIVSFGFPFTDLDEMYDYNQYLFIRAAANIPQGNERSRAAPEGADWQNKWVYFRASLEYPISFYMLKSTGLYLNQAVYSGPIASPTAHAPLDNIIFPQPAVTVGIEVQFLNWMSAEPNFQLSLGNPVDYSLIDSIKNKEFSMAAGVQLKFPLKLNSLMIEPFAAFTYPIKTSTVFQEFPLFLIGGGLQLCVRGGSSGAIFIDVNYMHTLKDTLLKNHYKPLYENPNVIHYQHFRIGIGAGYKFGIFNRNS